MIGIRFRNASWCLERSLPDPALPTVLLVPMHSRKLWMRLAFKYSIPPPAIKCINSPDRQQFTSRFPRSRGTTARDEEVYKPQRTAHRAQESLPD